MASKRGPLLPLFVIVGVILYLASRDDEGTPDEPEDAAVSELASSVPYARRPGRDTWPPLATTGAPAATAASSIVNYYLVLDGSGSMTNTECSGADDKITAALAAVSTFIGSVPAEANLALAVFDKAGLSERAALASGDRAALREQLSRVSADGATPLKSAIKLGYEKLTAQAQHQLGYGEYHLVVVTDGAPQPESEDPTAIVQTILAESPVILHTIGFCLGTDHVLNQPGRTLYMAADSPEALRTGLQSVLAEAPAFDVTQFQ
jgi:Ca-activated chloride channel family protein